jgi:tRNA-splicing ligase RtcB
MITTIGNTIIAGQPIENAVEQIRNCAQRSAYTALMADHHKGYSVPIGGVMADPYLIAPQCVGFDIACGMIAVETDASLQDVKANIKTIMNDLYKTISFGVGRANAEAVDSYLYDYAQWDTLEVYKGNQGIKATAKNQLGTVGSGNHWVNIFECQNGKVWVGAHFGSRGLGHQTATWFLDVIGADDSMESIPKVMACNSDLGEQYLKALDLCGAYAYEGREWVAERVLKILGANQTDCVHTHHNFLWRENHDGQDLWVGRKGATPCFPGQRGFVGASMTEACPIIRGTDSPLLKDLLYSTVHGAGRVMSRTEAAGKRSRKTNELILDGNGVPKKAGVVTQEMFDKAVKDSGIELRGGGFDESPYVYKRITEVLEHHENTIEILNLLKPIGVAMASHDTYDPYKD